MNEIGDIRERIRAKLEASKAAGAYVSEADHQKAWEAKVAAMLPSVEASEADRELTVGGDLVERLATSVERQATLAAIDTLSERWVLWPTAVHVLRELRGIVSRGEHVK